MTSERVADYDYDLPEALIANRPTADRAGSRMMLVDRSAGTVTHRMFREFASMLGTGDLVVLNNSKVIKARLYSTERRVEIFLLERVAERTWKCFTKPGRKTRVGSVLEIAGTVARVVEVLPEGERIVVFDDEPNLERYGSVPIPPYFKRDADEEDAERYQTVYADEEGSVAAPTAGLHFTEEVLGRIPHAFLTLHVGAGTFLPVKTEKIDDHVMHRERYHISAQTAAQIDAASRVVAIGTTVVRVLESQPVGALKGREGSTQIFIHPPFEFQRVGALLTNFHLPCSTLLMLVSALAGRELIQHAYQEAVRERYRFFSYGDCMLIV